MMTTSDTTNARANAVDVDAASSVTGYLNAKDAAALDEELMSKPGYSLEQLMELAGLSVAEAVYKVVKEDEENGGEGGGSDKKKKKILLICGPGNNGGDGLVAARHLVFFGYDSVVVYPKRPYGKNPHYANLVKQCEDVGVPILDDVPLDLSTYSAIVDAIFGFSFKGSPREPFATAIQQMMNAQSTLGVPVIAVDVPSGWNVDEGDVSNTGFSPKVLISLTTPKLCSKSFEGRHFVGGRFLPPAIAAKYNVRMPPYPGTSQVMEITVEKEEGKSSLLSASTIPEDGWEKEYAEYLESKYKQSKAEQCKDREIPTEEQKDESSWEADYAAYCSEKESRLDIVSVLDDNVTLDWNDRIGIQNSYTLKQKGWKRNVEWKETPYGAGLFANKYIPKGAILRVGILDVNLKQFTSVEDIDAFCHQKTSDKEVNDNDDDVHARRNYVKDYLYGFYYDTDENGYYLDFGKPESSVDDDESEQNRRLIGMWVPGNGLNHNEHPNAMYVATDVGINLIAMKDIETGTEIVDDYRRFGRSPKWLKPFAEEHNVTLVFEGSNDFV